MAAVLKRESGLSDDEAYQVHALQGVSRTFALTIPQLPPPLCRVVSNAYLLCRLADTVEDEPALSASQKRYFSEAFNGVVAGEEEAARFATEFAPLLTSSTSAEECDLVRNCARVIRITHSFNDAQRAALQRCISTMSEGMAQFQENQNARGAVHGLDDLPHLDRYCYYVAGVVGEMLTELFCDYCEAMAERRTEMLKLAVSFGQGLQMTNILKDIWEDLQRGACWLPRDVFRESGFDLDDLAPGGGEGFASGLRTLVGVARAHLRNALTYTLMCPRSEEGIRRFCLWALGMAVLTLRKIHRHPDFSDGQQVKISRRSVKATVLVSNLSAGRDPLLRWLFAISTIGLPVPPHEEQILLAS